MVSQPARRSGRGRQLRQPPVAEWAQAEQLRLAQPADVREPDFLATLAELRPRLAVVVAFGQIFPPALLALPEQGCINLHASLLPRHRGAAPIQAAILAGDRSTGITTMLMDEGLDTGPILLQRELPIGDEETAGELAGRLATAGAELVVETVEAMEAGRLEPRPQDPAQATKARRLRRADGIIDWHQSAQRIFNLLRGLTPWPGISTTFRGRPLKILWGRPLAPQAASPEGPGAFGGLSEGRLVVGCGDGTTFGVERLQRPGRKAVSAVAFANGERLREGERFG